MSLIATKATQRFPFPEENPLEKARDTDIFLVAQALNLVPIHPNSSITPVKIGEDTTSLTLYRSTNSFHRFSGKGNNPSGSTIDLYLHIKGGTVKEAIEWINNL